MSDDDTTPEALLAVARAIRDLGNADAATPMGGLEALGAVVKEIGELRASVDDGAAQRIGDGLDAVASSIDGLALAITQAARILRDQG